MKSLTKRIKKIEPMVDKNKAYGLKEAISVLKNMPKLKFDETVEIAVKLNVDPKQSQSSSMW